MVCPERFHIPEAALAQLPARTRPRARGGAGVEGEVRGVPEAVPGTGAAVHDDDERRAAARLGEGAAGVRRDRGDGDPRRRREGDELDCQSVRKLSRRRFGRPLAVHQDDHEGVRAHRAGELRRDEHALRRPRARDGEHPQRDGAPRRGDSVRRDVHGFLGLHAPADAAGGDHETAGHLRVHARFHRRGGGRADAPAGGTTRSVARDSPHGGPPPGGRQRDGGGVEGGARTPRTGRRRSRSRGRNCRPWTRKSTRWPPECRAARTSSPRPPAARPNCC